MNKTLFCAQLMQEKTNSHDGIPPVRTDSEVSFYCIMHHGKRAVEEELVYFDKNNDDHQPSIKFHEVTVRNIQHE